MRLIEDIKSKIDIFSIYPKAKIDIGRALDRINRFLNERDNSREYREFVPSYIVLMALQFGSMVKRIEV